MELLQTNQVKEALAITTTLVDRDPHSSESQEVYALALIARGWELQKQFDVAGAEYNWSLALEAYNKACKQSKNPGFLQLSAGQLAQMLYEKKLAIFYYQSAHTSELTDARAAFFLSQIYLLDKEWELAKHWATESLQRAKNEPYALLTLALAEAELGNFGISSSLAERGCSISPNDPNLRFIQARIVRIQGKPKQALEVLLSLPTSFKESDLYKEEIALCNHEIEYHEQ